MKSEISNQETVMELIKSTGQVKQVHGIDTVDKGQGSVI